MGTCSTRLDEATLKQNNIINGIVENPAQRDELVVLAQMNSKINPKKKVKKINEENLEEIQSSLEELAEFPDFYYINRTTGQMFLIKKDSTNEVILKNDMVLPQESAVGHLLSKDILMIGGVLKEKLVESVIFISITLQSTFKVAPLPKACKQGQAHEYKNWVYYIGGVCESDNGLTQAPLMRYNLKQDLWQDLFRYGEDYRFNRIINMGTCILGNKLLLVGGQRLNSKNTLSSNKKIFSINIEKGFKVEVEGKLPYKLLKPSIATGVKQGIITGGITVKSSKFNRKSFHISLKGDNCYLTPIGNIGIDLIEQYPSIYTSKYAMFISYPYIALRMKNLVYWLCYQVIGKTSRIKLEVPKIFPEYENSESSEESEIIENASKKHLNNGLEKKSLDEYSARESVGKSSDKVSSNAGRLGDRPIYETGTHKHLVPSANFLIGENSKKPSEIEYSNLLDPKNDMHYEEKSIKSNNEKDSQISKAEEKNETNSHKLNEKNLSIKKYSEDKKSSSSSSDENSESESEDSKYKEIEKKKPKNPSDATEEDKHEIDSKDLEEKKIRQSVDEKVAEETNLLVNEKVPNNNIESPTFANPSSPLFSIEKKRSSSFKSIESSSNDSKKLSKSEISFDDSKIDRDNYDDSKNIRLAEAKPNENNSIKKKEVPANANLIPTPSQNIQEMPKNINKLPESSKILNQSKTAGKLPISRSSSSDSNKITKSNQSKAKNSIDPYSSKNIKAPSSDSSKSSNSSKSIKEPYLPKKSRDSSKSSSKSPALIKPQSSESSFSDIQDRSDLKPPLTSVNPYQNAPFSKLNFASKVQNNPSKDKNSKTQLVVQGLKFNTKSPKTSPINSVQEISLKSKYPFSYKIKDASSSKSSSSLRKKPDLKQEELKSPDYSKEHEFDEIKDSKSHKVMSLNAKSVLSQRLKNNLQRTENAYLKNVKSANDIEVVEVPTMHNLRPFNQTEQDFNDPDQKKAFEVKPSFQNRFKKIDDDDDESDIFATTEALTRRKKGDFEDKGQRVMTGESFRHRGVYEGNHYMNKLNLNLIDSPYLQPPYKLPKRIKIPKTPKATKTLKTKSQVKIPIKPIEPITVSNYFKSSFNLIQPTENLANEIIPQVNQKYPFSLNKP
ncbi:hypothetical protein SteCoe_23158 [Stentor coeruleus]|uniref:Uncharacterized protein n=1 Tax=Stentor coeruleus TaxID=5963 RepID=A0A1R2BKK6_9CILI|nr:hypothetical protein SteCoe_23158 [Stentor coeruleus]